MAGIQQSTPYINDFLIISGNSNIPLATKISDILGKSLAQALVDKFSDGEVQIELQESVRGKDIYIIQSISPPNPSDNLMELLSLIDACKRASARKIAAVIPYYGFARQDRRPYSARVPISAKLVADMLSMAGINNVITLDLHSEQIQGFFNCPVDNIYSSPVFVKDIITTYKQEKPTIISPDVGGVLRARAVAKQFNGELAIIDKRRPKPNKARVMNIIGEIRDKHCVIVDDMVDTAGTLCKAAAALEKHGAASVSAYITHPILSDSAFKNIMTSNLKELVISDTIQQDDFIKNAKGKVRTVSIASILGETVRRIHISSSVEDIMPKV